MKVIFIIARFGWIGFNGGSALAANGAAALAALNTSISAAAGMLNFTFVSAYTSPKHL